jgi:hypothetical protein
VTTAPRHARREWTDLALLCFLAIVSDLSYAGLTPLVVAYENLLHFDLQTAGGSPPPRVSALRSAHSWRRFWEKRSARRAYGSGVC